MNEKEMLLEIEEKIIQNKKDEKEYCNKENIYFILFAIFCIISIFSFILFFASYNIFFMISLIAGSVATINWIRSSYAYSLRLEECRKNDSALEAAIWIVKNWIKDGKFDSKFFKQVQVESNDKYDRAISILKKDFDIRVCEE